MAHNAAVDFATSGWHKRSEMSRKCVTGLCKLRHTRLC